MTYQTTNKGFKLRQVPSGKELITAKKICQASSPFNLLSQMASRAFQILWFQALASNPWLSRISQLTNTTTSLRSHSSRIKGSTRRPFRIWILTMSVWSVRFQPRKPKCSSRSSASARLALTFMGSSSQPTIKRNESNPTHQTPRSWT